SRRRQAIRPRRTDARARRGPGAHRRRSRAARASPPSPARAPVPPSSRHDGRTARPRVAVAAGPDGVLEVAGRTADVTQPPPASFGAGGPASGTTGCLQEPATGVTAQGLALKSAHFAYFPITATHAFTEPSVYASHATDPAMKR